MQFIGSNLTHKFLFEILKYIHILTSCSNKIIYCIKILICLIAAVRDMPIENDIDAFKSWANRMGCPMNCMPTDEALNSLFRSRQSSLIFNMMERIRPLDEVKLIKKNIFYSKMKKIEGKIIDKCNRGLGPPEYQRYCEIEDVKKEKQEAEIKLKNAREKCNIEMLRAKSVKREKLLHTLENLEVRCNILEFKCEDLDTKICEEKQFEEKILKAFPTKLTALNMNKENTSKAITEAFQELDTFYTTCITSSNSHYIEEAKEQLWSKMKNLFSKIPNASIWNVLMSMQDEMLQKMKELNEISNKNQKYESNDSESLSDFDLEVLKSKASVIGLVSKYLSVKKEEARLNDVFTSNYQRFCDELEFKVNTFGGESLGEDSEILSDYIVQYNTYNYNKGQQEFLVKEIERCKKIVEENKKTLEDHELLLGSLKQMYSEIDATVKKTQYEMMQLGEIKDKIQYSKNMMQHLINDIQLMNHKNANKTKTNLSAENFYMNMSMLTDTLKLSPPGPGLCSTKLDIDICNSTTIANSTLKTNSSIISQNMSVSNLPQHSLELAVFKDLPIFKLKVIPPECQMSVSPNPYLLESTDSPESLDLQQNCPGILLRPSKALENFEKKVKWYKDLKKFESDIRPDIQLPEINESLIKNKISEQNDEISRLIDEIEDIGVKSERALIKSKKYYEFLIENPLKQYIPATKLVNNQTYSDYDAEYNMYYRMVMSSNGDC